jgi:hypothetical protein
VTSSLLENARASVRRNLNWKRAVPQLDKKLDDLLARALLLIGRLPPPQRSFYAVTAAALHLQLHGIPDPKTAASLLDDRARLVYRMRSCPGPMEDT